MKLWQIKNLKVINFRLKSKIFHDPWAWSTAKSILSVNRFLLTVTYCPALYPWQRDITHRNLSCLELSSPIYFSTIFPPMLNPMLTSLVEGYLLQISDTMAAYSSVPPKAVDAGINPSAISPITVVTYKQCQAYSYSLQTVECVRKIKLSLNLS